MSPPELAADAPIPLLGQPVDIGVPVANVRVKRHVLARGRTPLAFGSVQGGLGQSGCDKFIGGSPATDDTPGHIAHAHEPLFRQIGLNRGLGAVRGADFDLPIFNRLKQAESVQILNNLVTRRKAVQPLIRSGLVVQRTIGAQNVNQTDLFAVTAPDLIVIGVVARSDFHTTAAEFGFCPFVADERHRAVQQRQTHLTTGAGHGCELFKLRQMRLASFLKPLHFRFQFDPFFLTGAGQAFLCFANEFFQGSARVGMAGHRGIAQHGFGPRCGHHHVFRFAGLRINDRIAQMPEMPLDAFIHNLVIRDRSLQMAVPVDQARPAENQTVPEQMKKGPLDGPGTDRVHGKALAVPVARAAQGLLLADNAGLVLLFPVPDAFDQGLAANIVACFAFQLEQTLFHNSLRGDTGVVRAGHPQRVLSQHAMPARQHILHDVVHGMPHVQRAGDIRQRHHDDIAVLVVVRGGGKGFGLGPALEDRFFQCGRVVLAGQCVWH